VVYGELFDAVQRERVFPDSKTFPDALPKTHPDAIMREYRRARAAPGFDLRAFVAAHFTPPETPASGFRSAPQRGACAHIESLWPLLVRQPDPPVEGSSLLPLPRPYVVPGGRFREIYYWDTYFTMLGLQAAGRHGLIRDMLENFAHLIRRYGHIPNGNRSYYLSRSQPPFFAAMVELAAAGDGENLIADYLPELEREYAFWMQGAEGLAPGNAYRRVVRLRDGSILNRYWDDRPAPRDEAWLEDIETAAASGRPAAEVYRNLRAAAESGWDFSSRWLTDGSSLATIRTVELLPVDLNSLMFQLERTIARGHVARGAAREAQKWSGRADTRARAVRTVFWNERRRTFTDYLWRTRQSSDAVTAAGLFPLFVGIAEPAQAHAVANTVRLKLLRPEGIVPTPVISGQQWDAPNGWAPLQWIASRGLRGYGEDALAEAIERGWNREVTGMFERDGRMLEKYDVTGDAEASGGEYPNQDGFGWTNGVFGALACSARERQ
jgi:alpha,alpha-trehalase